MSEEIELFKRCQKICHDIRQPMGIITGYVELLEELELQKMNDDTKEAIQAIIKNVYHLHTLTADMLTLGNDINHYVKEALCERQERGGKLPKT